MKENTSEAQPVSSSKTNEKIKSEEPEKLSIYQIYDRIFKRIFILSDLAVINLINGLFGTNYPSNSTVHTLQGEFVKRNLEKRVADIIVVINSRDIYHLEAQMTKDSSIIIRIFEYGFHHALMQQDNENILHFPEPVIIYLESGVKVPEKSSLLLDFGTQGSFKYEVKNFAYQEQEIIELNQKKMILLIPFQLLKVREIMKKKASKENFDRLKKIVLDDILGSIKANLQVGNITSDDADQLQELTSMLLRHIYENYGVLGGYEKMKPYIEGAMVLPLDKYRIRIDELEEEKAKAEEEKAKAEEEKAKAEEEKAKAEEEIRILREKIKELEQQK